MSKVQRLRDELSLKLDDGYLRNQQRIVAYLGVRLDAAELAGPQQVAGIGKLRGDAD